MKFVELGLCPELVRAVTAAGYTTPTPIQERAIPIALEGRDLIACAQTGTGKTAAFLLPLLQRLAAGKPSRRPRALIVTPTRELAAQISDMATVYGKHLNLRHTVIFGGVGMDPQTRLLRSGLDLLIATPGRLLDHMGRNQADLSGVECVVLDEADRMLDMGFLPDVRRVLAALPKSRQNLFYSATMPDEIEDLIRRTTNNPEMVEVTRRATPVDTVSQVVHPVAMTRKKDLLATLLKRPEVGQTLVFTRTKARANQLTRGLEHSGRRVAAIHGNKSQNARTRALDGFRSGSIDTLIATDIAARGIDVDGISHVINFDLPNVPEDYVHRIGRTARAGASGHAISLAAPEERPQLAAIERLVGRTIRREDVGGFSVTADPHAAPEPPRGRRPSQYRGNRTGSGAGGGSGARPYGSRAAGNQGRGRPGRERRPA
ncbi:MAG: DEAD/DEAH box helicase [Acidobacteria bacterium]|nr:DEAD/DEAH box helicase [Acidobacteriota bacterium]